MSDIVVRSSLSKEETLKRLGQIFKEGNDLDVEMTVLHGEYYLSKSSEYDLGLIPGKRKSISLDPFYMQFRVKERVDSSTIHITPQSKAFFIALSSMFLSMGWIIILVSSLAEKRWLDIQVYLIGIALTLGMLLYLKSSGKKEKRVIERIVREFES